MRLGYRTQSVMLGAVALVLVATSGSSAAVDPVDHVVPHQGGTPTVSTAPSTRVDPLAKRRRIGTSVQDRAIFAYRLGDPDADVKAVILGEMHGNEPAGVQVARAVIRGAPIRGIDLWVVPTMNPDGLAAHTRQNARGVDLNRNWGYKWIHQTGTYNSGPHPFSEPETRAMKRFLQRIDPVFVVSLHQPLHGVDSDQVKNPYLMNRLSRNLNLPKKPFTCGGVCHGTMTGWFNFHHAGACITVEFGSAPSHTYLTHRAATGTVRSVLGHY